MKTLDEQKAEYEQLRSDPALSAARHDEIINLRLLLIDIAHELQSSEYPEAQALRQLIIDRAIKWGKPGDCA